MGLWQAGGGGGGGGVGALFLSSVLFSSQKASSHSCETLRELQAATWLESWNFDEHAGADLGSGGSEGSIDPPRLK